MSRLRERIAAAGTAARVGLAVLVLGAVGLGATLAGGDRNGPPDRDRPAVATLLDGERRGRIAVGRDGRPVRGPDGRPLRVAADGRTLVDGRGRAVRDGRGRPVGIGAGIRIGHRDRDRTGTRRERGSRPGAGPPGRSRAPRPGPASAARPIRIGIAVRDPGAENEWVRSLGVDETMLDAEPIVKAVIAHLNARGGIRGRRIEWDRHRYVPTVTTTLDDTAAELCARFLRTRPFAVTGPTGADALLARCLRVAGIPVVSSWPIQGAQDVFGDNLLASGGLALDRIGEPFVQALHRDGFFRGARAGLLLFDEPGFREGGQALEAALARAGVRVIARKRLPMPPSLSEFPRMLAHVKLAVAEFKARNVTHVLALDGFGGAIGFFMVFAQEQRYLPKYALNSTNAPNTLTPDLVGASLPNVTGAGWVPLIDAARDPAPPSGHRLECQQVFRGAGLAIGEREPFSQYMAYAYCDSLLMLRASLERSGRWSRAAVRHGFEALGGAPASALTLRSWVGPGRHDGATEMRIFRYYERCACLLYD